VTGRYTIQATMEVNGEPLSIQLELDGADGIVALAALALAEPIVFLQAELEAPSPTLFPSKRFLPAVPIRVTPVLSSDNYMAVVPDFLAAAERDS
jgi:hypothetical protein